VRIVGLGPGDADSVPAAALAALDGVDAVFVADDLADEVRALLVGARLVAMPEPEAFDPDAVIVALDARAHRLARRFPDATTVPARDVLRNRAIGAEVAQLAAVGAHLRRECPWDREQTAATIVPHTVEEAFEVAEAVASGDPIRQLDEIGDLLFQSVFLAQLLEEERDDDLGSIARGQTNKLISRHPHVYGDAVAESAGRVLDLWERRKREERSDQGIFHDMPAGLPALAFATKAYKRAASVGFRFADVPAALAKLHEEVAELDDDTNADELGDVLLAAVTVGYEMGADPELALRAAAARFRGRVETAARLASEAGEDFEALAPAGKLIWYERGRIPR
jgi:MazG family protein